MGLAVAALGLPVLLAALAIAHVHAALPQVAAAPPRLLLPDGGIGIRCGDTYAYLLRCPDGGALAVDAGADADAVALRRALGEWGLTAADVRAVLLTHGHAEARGGAAALGDGPVYVAAEDWLLAAGRARPRARWPRLLARLRPGRGAPEARLQAWPAGLQQDICGLQVTAVPLPGHTAGSLAYRIGATTFIGDALRLDRVPPTPLPAWANAQPAFAQLAPSRLALLPCKVLADARVGTAPAPEPTYWDTYGAAAR